MVPRKDLENKLKQSGVSRAPWRDTTVKASTSSLILLFCSLVTACGTGSNSSRTIVHNPPPERVAENERPVEYIIARFRFLLDEITTKFVENRKQIAEITVKSHELLQQKGAEEFLLNVMEGINKIMPVLPPSTVGISVVKAVHSII
jgi:hypothetical protein